MQEQQNYSGRGHAAFLASIAAVLLILGVALLSSGLGVPAPELVPLGIFELLWAITCGLSAAAVALRAPSPWRDELLAQVPRLRLWLSVGAILAPMLARLGSPDASSFDAPSFPHLLPPLLSAGLGILLARQLGTVPVATLPEALGLSRWARLSAWLSLLGAGSVAARHLDTTAPWASAVGWTITGVTVALGVDALRMNLSGWTEGPETPFPLASLPSVAVLAHRWNPISSVLDSVESFLGVDLRGSWALREVRRGAEPLAIVAVFVGWLATSFTEVKIYEQGVLSRFGTIVDGALDPGLHVHLPWPIDVVQRVPTGRIMSVSIGNSGEEEDPDRENVLWAQRHEATEFTFLLGNGRDLVTIDGKLRYRIRDLRAWLTATAQPDEVLRALVHAAVTRRTVDRSLDQVLSENMASLCADVAAAVQKDADALGLGVDVIGMTIGGMHPPVDIASEYEAVVSAQIARDTLVLDAKAGAERDLPAAEASALDTTSTAEADALHKVAAANGDAAAFLGIRASYEAEPDLYAYRRRLEALEANLPGTPMVIVDDRLERDGASLWLTP